MTDKDGLVRRLPDDGSPTIAVTGAAGYIGSRVLGRLRVEHPDWDVIGLDNQYRGQVESVGGVRIEDVDIRNREALEASLEGADVVLHLAAISGVEDCEDNPELAYEVNVVGTSNVAWFCKKTGAALTFPYSVAVLGDPKSFPITGDQPREPLNWYGQTKYIGESAVEGFATASFPAHLFLKSNVYGEHVADETVVSKSNVVQFFVEKARAGETLTVYEPGTQSRNFVHVKDIARAYVLSAEAHLQHLAAGDTGSEVYELASREERSVLEIAELVRERAAELGRNVDVSLVENPRAGETLVEQFTVDISRTVEKFGWEPTLTIEESVSTLLDT